jgi:hypothetical protein
MSRKFGPLVALATALFAFMALAPAAHAASAHWIVDPYCSGNDPVTALPGAYESLSCSGKAAGLGNGPIFVVVQADAGCTNQDGTHVIPGKSTTSSGPFYATNGNFTFGAENNQGANAVTAYGPTTCRGQSQTSYISTQNVWVSLYECTNPDQGPVFDKRGHQTNSGCTLVLGPTQAGIA